MASNNTIVCHLTKCTEGSMVASARIARFISEQLGAPLVHEEGEDLEYARKVLPGLNLFILVNSPTGFAPEAVRRFSAEALYHAKHAVFANNDYKIKPPSQSKTHMRRMFNTHKGESSDFYGYSLWTTVPGNMKAWKRPLDSYVNWNQLTYVPHKGLSHEQRQPGLLYWGALRKGREAQLQRLLAGAGFPVVISTAPQSVTKYQEHVPDATYVSQLKPLHTGLLDYRATVYVQDEYSDKVYCSLANRFYEALSAGLAIFIDKRSANTFKKAELVGWEDFIVSRPEDIAALLPNAERIAAAQRKLWGQDHQATLVQQLEEAHAKTQL